jgi:hypothetical protein
MEPLAGLVSRGPTSRLEVECWMLEVRLRQTRPGCAQSGGHGVAAREGGRWDVRDALGRSLGRLQSEKPLVFTGLGTVGRLYTPKTPLYLSSLLILILILILIPSLSHAPSAPRVTAGNHA